MEYRCVPKITFETTDGKRIEVDGRAGESVMLAALVGMVPGIEAECGGACSCATCHVYVDPDWRTVVGPPNTLEAGMLEMLDNVSDASRLGCQIKVRDEIDGLVVKVPD
jgi:2Fe-2S ferredoxin